MFKTESIKITKMPIPTSTILNNYKKSKLKNEFFNNKMLLTNFIKG